MQQAMNPTRLNPSDFTEQELADLGEVFARSGHVKVIDDEGHETEVPKALRAFLGHLLGQMQRRRIITLMPHDEQFTTQAAADYLGQRTGLDVASVAADRGQSVAVVEPGVVLDELNRALKPHGLWFPVDVSTASRATIGGMCANNSCGSRSIRYGRMRDNVHAVTALLALSCPAGRHRPACRRRRSSNFPSRRLMPRARACQTACRRPGWQPVCPASEVGNRGEKL